MGEKGRAAFFKDRKLGFGLKTSDRDDGACFAYLPSGAIALCKDYEPISDEEVPPDILPALMTLQADFDGNRQ